MIIINYRGAGLLLTKFSSSGKLQVCLGKRTLYPHRRKYSLLGGGSHYNRSISLFGNLKWKFYSESYSETALREAKEECKLVGDIFPEASSLIPIQAFHLGVFNWKNFGIHLNDSNTKVLSINPEFESLNWYDHDKLPSPLFPC